MKRICPFREMECTERCKLNLLGSCAFESLRGIEDSLMFSGEKVEDAPKGEENPKQGE